MRKLVRSILAGYSQPTVQTVTVNPEHQSLGNTHLSGSFSCGAYCQSVLYFLPSHKKQVPIKESLILRIQENQAGRCYTPARAAVRSPAHTRGWRDQMGSFTETQRKRDTAAMAPVPRSLSPSVSSWNISLVGPSRPWEIRELMIQYLQSAPGKRG